MWLTGAEESARLSMDFILICHFVHLSFDKWVLLFLDSNDSGVDIIVRNLTC
jgi:hypothetical protein